MAMDYAVAVNEELRALKATGVDVVQLDEPWVRTAPDKATRFGIAAINRALEGIEGPTVVHLCFGYAAVVANKPSGYSFLPQLADTVAQQISIEAAQPKLDLGVLRDLSGKRIMLGVLDLGDPAVETRGAGGGADSRRAALRRGGPADPGAGLRDEIPAARHRLRQAEGAGRGRGDRAARARGLRGKAGRLPRIQPAGSEDWFERPTSWRRGCNPIAFAVTASTRRQGR